MKRLHAATLGTLFVIGCFLPSFEKVDEAGGGGAGGAPQGGEGGEGLVCESATFVEPPAEADPGGQFDFYAAMRTVNAGELDIPNRPGFDLDAACTCCQGCALVPTCTPPPGSFACDEVETIANAGRDNNFAKVIAEINTGFPGLVTSDDMTAKAEVGSWSVLVRVFHYNGLEDDEEVSVALYATDGAALPPEWNGDDPWTVREDSLTPGFTDLDDAISVRDDAYVAGGLVVARFGATPLRLVLTNELVVSLHNAVLQARIVKDENDRFGLQEGVIAGSWLEGDIFRAIGGMRVDGVGPPICLSSPGYGMFVHSPICRHRDANDAGSLAACDSLSFGMTFDADAIASLPAITPPVGTAGCIDGDDPSVDAC